MIPVMTEDIDRDAEALVIFLNTQRCHHPSKGERDALIESKRAEGKSTRQIAEEVGCSKDTVARMLNSGVANETPQEIKGKDGKTYKRLASAPKKERRTPESIKVDEEIKARLLATS